MLLLILVCYVDTYISVFMYVCSLCLMEAYSFKERRDSVCIMFHLHSAVYMCYRVQGVVLLDCLVGIS
jgi:hypothetical protein